jgi:hypothetical protein
MLLDINRLASVISYVKAYKIQTGKTISRQAVYEKVRSGRLPSVMIEGRNYIVMPEDWVIA